MNANRFAVKYASDAQDCGFNPDREILNLSIDDLAQLIRIGEALVTLGSDETVRRLRARRDADLKDAMKGKRK